jgi:hypothetical protein
VKLKKLETNRKKGVWKLPVVLAGAGKLVVWAPTIEREQLIVPGATTVRVAILPRGSLAKRMKTYGEGRVKVTVFFTPVGGPPATVTKVLKLLKTVPPIRN